MRRAGLLLALATAAGLFGYGLLLLKQPKPGTVHARPTNDEFLPLVKGADDDETQRKIEAFLAAPERTTEQKRVFLHRNVTAFPRSAVTHEALALLYLSKGDHSRASTHFARAANAGWSAAAGPAARELFATGQWDEAVQRLEQLKTSGASDSDLPGQLALAYVRSGLPGKARAALASASPKDENAVTASVELLLLAGSPGDALSAAKTLVERSSTSAANFLLLGRTGLASGNLESALEGFQAASRMRPSDAAAWAGLASTYRHLRFARQEMDALQKLADLGAAERDQLVRLIALLNSQNRPAEASRYAAILNPFVNAAITPEQYNRMIDIALNSASRRERAAAASACLAYSRIPETPLGLKAARAMIAGSDGHSRWWGYTTLGFLDMQGIRDEQTRSDLLQGLNDKTSEGRKGAVTGLGMLGDDDLMEPQMAQFRKDADFQVRERIACSLAHTGLWESRTRLRAAKGFAEVLEDPSQDRQVKAWAHQALNQITRRDFGLDGKKWQEWLKDAE